MKRHHYFYAVPLPKDTKQQIDQWSSDTRAALSFQRWVYPQDLHITLAFLGGTEEEPLKQATQRIHKATDSFSPFSLKTSNLGVFGSPSSPRILWADVSSSPSLVELRDMVYKACQQEGYELDKRPFNPHITIARKWAGENQFEEDILKPFSLSTPLQFEVQELVLYRTHLDRIPKYEVVERFHLG
ncbi:RNA 2',3'-cyclic phosphodiesterase [Bacillus sp. AK031]